MSGGEIDGSMARWPNAGDSAHLGGSLWLEDKPQTDGDDYSQRGMIQLFAKVVLAAELTITKAGAAVGIFAAAAGATPDANSWSWPMSRARPRSREPVIVAPLALEADRRFEAIFAAEQSLNSLLPDLRRDERRRIVAPLVEDLERCMRAE